MSGVIKFFAEFKSIFTSDDVLKENERHANIVVAATMFNIFITAIIIYIFTLVGLFNVNKSMMLDATIRSVFTLLIPSLIAFLLKGKGKYLKYVLLIFLTVSIGAIYSLLTYTATLLLIIPILLAARYYSKKFTIFVAIISIFMLGISEYLGAHFGLLDLNYVELPQGTTMTIETNILNAVKSLDLNEKEVVKYIMLQSYLPKLVIYSTVIAFACAQISQSGKNMIEKQKELSEEGARIESELNLANAIQKNMLPSIFPPFPEHKEIEIYANMMPAKEVGGDFYDMFLIDENHLAIVIADVSGKGVPAALIMMITKTLIKNTALNGKPVDEVFNSVNNMLCEGNQSNHFVTSWFGILNLKDGKLEFVNAGHNPPLVYVKRENKFEFLKTKPNLILAAMENTKYIKHEAMLEPGDKLFLYTDGVTEATNEKNELYGEERLQNYLNHHIEENVENTIKGIKNDIDRFVGNASQFDDITMLEFLFKEKKG
ncbi:MAG: PP2C family protein-serine/threonine phosphatase [Clostridia bacterium]|nr:PP2C family protein-serine/threonine phosphatase [Clostridia bacterium]